MATLPLSATDRGSYDFWVAVATKYENQHLMRRSKRITRNHSQAGWPISTSNANQRYGKTESPQIRHFDLSNFRFFDFFFANAWRMEAEKDNAKPTPRRWAASREARVFLSLRREYPIDHPVATLPFRWTRVFLGFLGFSCGDVQKNQHQMRPIGRITRNHSQAGDASALFCVAPSGRRPYLLKVNRVLTFRLFWFFDFSIFFANAWYRALCKISGGASLFYVAPSGRRSYFLKANRVFDLFGFFWFFDFSIFF